MLCCGHTNAPPAAACIHLQRLLVRQDHYDAVVSALVEKTKLLKKGNPLQPDTFVGPLITESDAVRIEGWVNDAVAKGGQVLAGGKRYGQVYDATIVARCDHKCDLWVEEAFAPVKLATNNYWHKDQAHVWRAACHLYRVLCPW